MGFGKHAGLTFSQVMLNHHDYVTWAVTSYHEGPVNWRLERFVKWYLSHSDRPLAVKKTPPSTSPPGFQLQHQDEGAQREPCKELPDTGCRHADFGTVPPAVGRTSARQCWSPLCSQHCRPQFLMDGTHASQLRLPDEAASDPESEELQSMEGERIKALEEELQELRRKRNQKNSRSRHS